MNESIGKLSNKKKKPKLSFIETIGIVSEMKRETIDTQTLRIKTPFLENKPFSFKPGQFVMVRPEINGKIIPRAYSISSSPTRAEPDDGYFDLTVRQTETPTVSKWLNDRKIGDEILFRGPYGHFYWDENDPEAEEIFLLGAGSGITPLKSILEYVHDKKYSNKVTLLYSVRYKTDIISYAELKELTENMANAKLVITLTREKDQNRWKGNRGRIDEHLIDEEFRNGEFDKSKTKFYMCGTPAFINSMTAILEKLGFTKDRILHEKWD